VQVLLPIANQDPGAPAKMQAVMESAQAAHAAKKAARAGAQAGADGATGGAAAAAAPAAAAGKGRTTAPAAAAAPAAAGAGAGARAASQPAAAAAAAGGGAAAAGAEAAGAAPHALAAKALAQLSAQPPKVPRTALDFERACKSLLHGKPLAGGGQAPPEFCSYVQAIPPGSYREVFKSQLTPAMIGYLVAGLGTADAASLEFAEAALRELSGVQRCGVLAAGVSKQTKQQLRALFSQLGAVGRDVGQLQKLFHC
jgi:hypothetical protein